VEEANREGPGRVTRLSELLDRQVVTESGRSLGRAFDVRGRWTGKEVQVTALVVGRGGFLERLGIGSSQGERRRHHKTWKHDTVPWEAVLRLQDGRIVVRDGTESG
jgi:sporulation protein YlmC with PRC-barrel domain